MSLQGFRRLSVGSATTPGAGALLGCGLARAARASRTDYNERLERIPKEDLVPAWWREKEIAEKKAAAEGRSTLGLSDWEAALVYRSSSPRRRSRRQRRRRRLSSQRDRIGRYPQTGDVMQFDDSFVSRVRRAVQMSWLYRNPVKAYRHRFTHPDDAVVTHQLRNGPALTVHAGPADIRIINEIWMARCYEQDPGIVPRRGWTVVDLGAHKGIYSARVLHLAPDARVFSYEPDPDNFVCLRTNVGDRATVHNIAVGSDDGVATLYRVPGQGGLQTTVAERARARGHYTDAPLDVEKVSLAKIIAEAEHVDLLKIDVEGAEYDLLLNSRPAVFDGVDRVVLEYDASCSEDASLTGRDLADRFRALGYTVDEGQQGVAKGYGARIMTATGRSIP